jgi:hypothetical protein|tara:strand:+ start:4402 stop:4755 length:354 start_codon:yes stop_codon:yes gene_type:complete
MGKFKKGNKLAPGGARPGAGAPTKEEVKARRAEVVGLERAKLTMEAKLHSYAAKIAERYVTRALEDKADAVLIDAVRKISPDARQEIDVNARHAVIYTMVEANAERRAKRIIEHKED